MNPIPSNGPQQLPAELSHGEHALYVWQNEQERWEVVDRFIEATLGRGERVTIVPRPGLHEETRRRLYEHESWRHELDEEQVQILTPEEFLPDKPRITQAVLRDRYRELLAAARQDGYGSLDLLVDLAAFLEAEGVEEKDLARIERANGRSFPFKVRLLCLLDRETAGRLGVGGLMRVVDSHTRGRVHLGQD